MGTTSAAGAQRTVPGAPGRGLPPSSHGARARRVEPPVQRITTAPVGQRQHQQQQIGRYLLSMGIRTTCFILAIFVPGPMRWVLVALAVVLPYVAVLVANAGRESVKPTTTQVTPPARPALTTAPSRPASEEPLVGHVTEAPAGVAGDAGSLPGAGGPARGGGAPRSWETERLRPPAAAGAAPGGRTARDGDQRSAA